jgi:S-adenosylmethionine decarboxylase
MTSVCFLARATLPASQKRPQFVQVTVVKQAELEVCTMLVHLMLELYGCDRELLSNEALVRRALDGYPARIGMDKVSPVHLYDIETSNPLDAGLSGFVIIAQSHVSLHAWPEYGEVDVDICSCKEFSQEDAIAFAKEIFQTDDVDSHFVVRGQRSLRPATPDPVRYAEAMAKRGARLAVR